MVIEKGIPHSGKSATSFAHIRYDGLTLKKGIRVNRRDGKNQLAIALDAVLNKTSVPGFAGTEILKSGMEWAPGAYIPSGLPDKYELRTNIDDLMRRYISFYTRYAYEIANQRTLIKNGDLVIQDYRKLVSKKRIKNSDDITSNPETIGWYFDIFYGQKELHSRDGIAPGESLIISPTEQYNGTYGWLSFKSLIRPPFITVAQTGSIGEAFVQTEACGVNDDCLILLPKNGIVASNAMLFVAAAVIRLERWRFSYGRKLTPARIADFRMDRSSELEGWVTGQIERWNAIAEQSVALYNETDI